MSPHDTPLLRAALYGLLFVLACRQSPAADPLLLEESFEDECAGMACGWEQVLGEPGGARWVSTVHPGEHGLVLDPGVTVRRGYDVAPRGVQVTMGALQGAISARCDPGGQLDFDLLVRDEMGGADAFGGRPRVPEEWGTPISFSLTSDFALLDGGVGTATVDYETTSLLVRNGGSAPCALDHLRIDGFGRGIRAPAGGCGLD